MTSMGWDSYPPFFVTLTMFGTLPAPFNSAGNWGRLLERAVLFWSCWVLTPAAPICCTPAWPYCWPNGAPDIPIYSGHWRQRGVRKFACLQHTITVDWSFISTLRVFVHIWNSFPNFENVLTAIWRTAWALANVSQKKHVAQPYAHIQRSIPKRFHP